VINNQTQRAINSKRILVLFLFLIGVQWVVLSQETKNDANSSTQKYHQLSLDARLVDVNKLYDQKKYESAYDLYRSIYNSIYLTSNEADQIKLLDLGIRLSFLVENFDDLEGYITDYYSLDPYFSSASLKESSELLDKYIQGFISTKDELFVYVNKHKQSLDLITASITVFTKDDIQRLGARTLLDLIRLAPGFAELGDNNERLIGTRGSSSTSLQDILILVDGHRISDVLTNTNGPDWINLDYAEQVELMRGPGSALYGGNAFNAVINVITKTGRFKNANGVKVQFGNGNDFSNPSFLRNTYRVSYEYSARLSNVQSFYFNGSYFQSGGSQIDLGKSKYNDVLPDVRKGDTIRQADTRGREFINAYAPGYNFFLTYINQSFKVTANAQSNSLINPRPVSQNLWHTYESDVAKTRTDKREFIQTTVNLFEKNPEFKHNLTFKLGGDHYNKDIYFPEYSTTNLSNQRLLGNEYRATSNLEFSSDSLSKHTIFKGKRFILAGLEAYVNHWDYQYFQASDSSFSSLGVTDYFTELEENKAQNEFLAAGYFQMEQHIIPEKLIGTIGVRINYHSVYSRFDDFNWGRHYSPRFALIYRAATNANNLHWLKLKLLYNSAFLPPPFLYRRRGIRGFTGAADLKPQEIESGEFIISGDITKDLSYGIFMYSNKLDQIILRTGSVYINAPDTRINAGIEAEIKYNANMGNLKLQSFANFSHAFETFFPDTLNHTYLEVLNPSFYSNKSSLRNFPINMINVGADFTTGAKRTVDESISSSKPTFSFGFSLQYIGKSIVNSNYGFDSENNVVRVAPNTSRELPEALLLDLRMRLNFKKMNIGISSTNATNKEYYLPAVAYQTKMLRAENRMFFINLNYAFN
jgi:outer membrane receptor protein involved in Fe transport